MPHCLLLTIGRYQLKGHTEDVKFRHHEPTNVIMIKPSENAAPVAVLVPTSRLLSEENWERLRRAYEEMDAQRAS